MAGDTGSGRLGCAGGLPVGCGLGGTGTGLRLVTSYLRSEYERQVEHERKMDGRPAAEQTAKGRKPGY